MNDLPFCMQVTSFGAPVTSYGAPDILQLNVESLGVQYVASRK